MTIMYKNSHLATVITYFGSHIGVDPDLLVVMRFMEKLGGHSTSVHQALSTAVYVLRVECVWE